MKKTFMSIAVLALSLGMAFAASDTKTTYYDLGNQVFSFKAGPGILLFTYLWGGDGTQESDFYFGIGEDGTHLKVGGYGSISYQAFINPYVALGGELGYSFFYSMSDSLFTAVPIQAKATFVPIQGTIDLPITLGLGGVYPRYEDDSLSYDGSLFTLFASLDVGLTWYFTENWGVGINAGIWIIPEFYSNKRNSIGAFIPATLSITYRH